MTSKNVCTTCGHENRLENKFCTRCGQNLGEEKIIGPCLSILTSEKNKVVFPLKSGRSTIGRDIGNSIVINDGLISKYHAAVRSVGEEFWIEDLESTNGVFVNGKKISQPQRLQDGNLIKLGGTILKFENKSI